MQPVSANASANAASPPVPASAAFVVRPFRAADQEQVVETFVEGMSEFGAHYKDSEALAAFLRSCVESDLSDIHGTYVAPGGSFWVVSPAADSARVVGMAGLEAKPGNACELRRMSVRRDSRRAGIGRLLLATLEQWAREQRVGRLWLTSAVKMTHAHAFYEAAGYARVERIRVADDFSVFKYEKQLAVDGVEP